MRHGDSQPARGKKCCIGDIVSNMCALRRRKTQRGCQTTPRREFVARILDHVRDTELARAMRDGGRTAAGDPRDDDSGIDEHVDTDAVKRRKRLRFAAVVIDVDAPVGEHPVNIAAQQAHVPRAVGESRVGH